MTPTLVDHTSSPARIHASGFGPGDPRDASAVPSR